MHFIGLHSDLYFSLLHFTGRRCELHRNCCRLVSDLAGNCCRVVVALNREDLIIVRVPLVGARGVIRHRRCHKCQGLELCHFSLVGFAVLGFQLNAGGCHGSGYSDLPCVGVGLPASEFQEFRLPLLISVLNGNRRCACLIGLNLRCIAILICKAYSIGAALPAMIADRAILSTAS